MVHVIGWAYCPGELIESVLVLVDGEPRVLADLGLPRRDVAATFGHVPGSGHAGWSATIDLSDHGGDRVAVGALAITASGLVERFDALPFKIAPARVGHIELPVANHEVASGVVSVVGWAVPPGRLARVEVRVDDREAGLARPLALPRPDLAPLPSPAAPLGGFSHTVDLSDHEVGDRVRIDADVVTRRGERTTIGPVEVVVARSRVSTVDAAARVRSLRARVADACARPTASSPPRVRLLVVTHQLDLGGGQLYLFELLRRLLFELDISCLVISAQDGPLRSELEELGATVHVCGDYPVSSPEQYETVMYELALLAREHGCNVALINTINAFLGADVAVRLGIPAVWAIHESYTLAEFWLAAYGPDATEPYVRERAVTALSSTAAVVFEAQATRGLYAEHGDPRRFITVPYGVTVADIDLYRYTSDVAQLRRFVGIPQSATVLLCMGTFEPRKGQGALAIAFAEIAAEFPDAILVLVGDQGTPYAEALHEVVRRLDIGDRIRLVPVVEDTYSWYAIADVLVSASDVESLPRSMLEAMAFATPVLAASVFGLPELIEDGVTGMLYPPRDIDALVDGLRRVLSTPREDLTKIGEAAAELVRTQHDAASYAGVVRTLLRGLLDNPDALPFELLPT